MESVPDIPPFLGPMLPTYPPLEQLVRVTGPADQNKVYPGIVQQLYQTVPPKLRDREACYVWEPNNFPLSVAVYDARLDGNYQGLPLYIPTCCGGGSSSSSSLSSH